MFLCACSCGFLWSCLWDFLIFLYVCFVVVLFLLIKYIPFPLCSLIISCTAIQVWMCVFIYCNVLVLYYGCVCDFNSFFFRLLYHKYIDDLDPIKCCCIWFDFFFFFLLLLLAFNFVFVFLLHFVVSIKVVAAIPVRILVYSTWLRWCWWRWSLSL